ncbi:hypothetical protein [Arthrobacter sp. ISL-72]|uniref:hypothetical protein n=1 Tax=Arthrobacter sp. ISL-72 TaxID=2819114 RepID=UPI001BE81200|nr:hypothetical protein [Arthrobacter sp. ISL-72]MBT2594897.1 hypothetical protein [Arthrobacter sp. ISL-72]
MPRNTSRRNKYPSHWPVHVSGTPAACQQLPRPGAVATEQQPAPTHPADDGELTASPWIGLHYVTEGI